MRGGTALIGLIALATGSEEPMHDSKGAGENKCPWVVKPNTIMKGGFYLCYWALYLLCMPLNSAFTFSDQVTR